MQSVIFFQINCTLDLSFHKYNLCQIKLKCLSIKKLLIYHWCFFELRQIINK